MEINQTGTTVLFLSTPSARRATGISFADVQQQPISIHALREEGDLDLLDFTVGNHISIHALREEGDATGEHLTDQQPISIHALREEGDPTGAGVQAITE